MLTATASARRWQSCKRTFPSRCTRSSRAPRFSIGPFPPSGSSAAPPSRIPPAIALSMLRAPPARGALQHARARQDAAGGAAPSHLLDARAPRPDASRQFVWLRGLGVLPHRGGVACPAGGRVRGGHRCVARAGSHDLRRVPAARTLPRRGAHLLSSGRSELPQRQLLRDRRRRGLGRSACYPRRRAIRTASSSFPARSDRSRGSFSINRASSASSMDWCWRNWAIRARLPTR